MKYAPAMLARITAATSSTIRLLLLAPRAEICAAGGFAKATGSGARRELTGLDSGADGGADELGGAWLERCRPADGESSSSAARLPSSN